MDATDPTLWIIVILGGLSLVGGGVFFFRSRKPKEEAIRYFRCPNCNRKLRYYPRQAGHRGMCNACKGRITFPSATDVRGC